MGFVLFVTDYDDDDVSALKGWSWGANPRRTGERWYPGHTIKCLQTKHKFCLILGHNLLSSYYHRHRIVLIVRRGHLLCRTSDLQKRGNTKIDVRFEVNLLQRFIQQTLHVPSIDGEILLLHRKSHCPDRPWEVVTVHFWATTPKHWEGADEDGSVWSEGGNWNRAALNTDTLEC